MIGKAGLAALLLMLALPLQAQETDAGEAAVAAAGRAHMEQLASRLAGDGQARDLAYAAILAEVAGFQAAAEVDPEQARAYDPRAAGWRETAFARAGADVVALTLLAGGSDGGNPVRQQALARWRQVEPGNLMSWLLDPEAEPETVMAAARNATHVNSHLYSQVRWIIQAYQAHPPTPEQIALLRGDEDVPPTLEGFAAVNGMAMLAAATAPVFQELFEHCGQTVERAAGSLQAQDCRRAAELLMAGDSLLLQSLGLGLARQSAGSNAERTALAEARRRFDWRMLEWGRLNGATPDHGLGDFLRLLGDPQIRTEQELVERLLTEAGVPLEPPPRWQPPSRG